MIRFLFQLIGSQSTTTLFASTTTTIFRRVPVVIVVIHCTARGINFFHHGPHLKDIIFRRGGQRKIGIRIPRQIRHLGRVTAVDKEQFGRSIFGVLRILFGPRAGQIPHAHASIGAARSENGFVVRGPLNGKDIVRVPAGQGVNLLLEGPHVPNANGFVRTPRGHDKVVEGVKGNAVNVGRVGVVDDKVRLVALFIPQTHFLVATDADNEVGVFVMPVHVFDRVLMVFQREVGLEFLDGYSGCTSVVVVGGVTVGERGHVPQSYRGIFAGRAQMSFFKGTPDHAVSFLGVAGADALRFGNHAAGVGRVGETGLFF
mmetsp:Transcript_15953/g.36647  ORF Transcript_15953/g.36647 Transcript_15953/m.36647 type:complete len:315 (-) Transcript_15953:10-954(-)